MKKDIAEFFDRIAALIDKLDEAALRLENAGAHFRIGMEAFKDTKHH